MNQLNKLRDKFSFDIMAGNIATGAGAHALINKEMSAIDVPADALRVGIGGGSVCETRVRTGVGVPQLSAVMDVRAHTDKFIPVISDGGIRYIGDVAKAICAGADAVMVGSLFSGTDEAPGDIHVSGKWPNASRYKIYRGSASESMKIASGTSRSHVEGTAKMVPLKGSVVNIVNDIVDGLKSAMSYLGSDNITDMQANAEFIKITHAGMAEALPHLLTGG
jgi:IMP dehydrogenase